HIKLPAQRVDARQALACHAVDEAEVPGKQQMVADALDAVQETVELNREARVQGTAVEGIAMQSIADARFGFYGVARIERIAGFIQSYGKSVVEGIGRSRG